MIITARFNGTCSGCGLPTLKGSQIDYLDKKAYHPGCAGETEAATADDQVHLADRLGFTHYDWPDLKDSGPAQSGDGEESGREVPSRRSPEERKETPCE